MKRFLLLMLLCGFSTLLLCGCSSNELTDDEMEKRETIQEFFGIELPEKCEIVSYEYTLEEDDYGGGIYTLVKTNKKGKNNIIQQLEDKENQYSLSEGVGFDELEQIPLEKEDLRAVYRAHVGPPRNLYLDHRGCCLKQAFIAEVDKEWFVYLRYYEGEYPHLKQEEGE